MKIHSTAAVSWDSCETQCQEQTAGIVLVLAAHPGLSFVQELLQLICDDGGCNNVGEACAGEIPWYVLFPCP